MKIGITGTQQGMSPRQRAEFSAMLYRHRADFTEFHHGDCIGADGEAHDIVRATYPHVRIIIHPPNKPGKRAWKEGDESKVPRPYLDRNRNISDACDLLIACPKEDSESLRSGTWSTIRYARACGKRTCVIYPRH